MRIRTLFAVMALSWIAATAWAADVSGTWAMTVESPLGSGSPVFTLQQKGEEITGRYRGGLGEAPVAGTLKGNALSLAFTVNVDGSGELRIVYTGTVDGNSTSGKVAFGDLGEGTFKGTKQ